MWVVHGEARRGVHEGGKLARVDRLYDVPRGGEKKVVDSVCFHRRKVGSFLTAREQSRADLSKEGRGVHAVAVATPVLIRRGAHIERENEDPVKKNGRINCICSGNKARLASSAATLAIRTSRASTCLACLEENPSIALLCCDKEMHCSCLSAWIDSQRSTKQIRLRGLLRHGPRLLLPRLRGAQPRRYACPDCVATGSGARAEKLRVKVAPCR
jgi:hypothetical protein